MHEVKGLRGEMAEVQKKLDAAEEDVRDKVRSNGALQDSVLTYKRRVSGVHAERVFIC